MKIASRAGGEVDFLVPPHESKKNSLEHILGIRGAPGHAISRAKDLVVVFLKQDLDLIRGIWHGSEVFNGLHAFLLDIVSSHKTPPGGEDYKKLFFFFFASEGGLGFWRKPPNRFFKIRGAFFREKPKAPAKTQ